MVTDSVDGCKKTKKCYYTIVIMSCGTEDFLLERNREFHAFLEKEGVAHTYEEWSGIHDMVFWSKSVERFVPDMFG